MSRCLKKREREVVLLAETWPVWGAGTQLRLVGKEAPFRQRFDEPLQSLADVSRRVFKTYFAFAERTIHGRRHD